MAETRTPSPSRSAPTRATTSAPTSTSTGATRPTPSSASFSSALEDHGQVDEVQSLSPEYLYTTDQNAENFNYVQFDPLGRPKNDLSPSNPIKPLRRKKKYKTNAVEVEFCKKNPSHPRCRKRDEAEKEKEFCKKYPNSKRCRGGGWDDGDHDEGVDDYAELGLFSESVRWIFDPNNRIEQNKVDKPLATIYEQSRDDSQLSVKKVVRTECKCKDGRVVMGWLDTTTGQKDCSPCRPSAITKPNIYKNYRTKKAKANFSDKKLPLRKQIGVSHFGDVEMKGCQTGNANNNASLEKVNAVSTLNNVVNIDTIDSRGGAQITAPQNNSGMPISMYDNDPTNIYGVL